MKPEEFAVLQERFHKGRGIDACLKSIQRTRALLTEDTQFIRLEGWGRNWELSENSPPTKKLFAAIKAVISQAVDEEEAGLIKEFEAI
jgi:hypothetical protein